MRAVRSSPHSSQQFGIRIRATSLSVTLAAVTTRSGPLVGVRVLELGSFIAGPFAGQLLGDYGAEVIKIEDPDGGDPMRTWGVTVDGAGLWWPTIARNKQSVVLDLRRPGWARRGARARRAVRCGHRELPAGSVDRVGPRLRRAQCGRTRASSSPTCPASARPGRGRRRPGSVRSARRSAGSATRPAIPIGRRRGAGSASATRSPRCSP